jgi:hypothetical protein
VKPSTESVFGWISTIEHEWLLVFDNADGDPDEVAQFFPPGNRGNVLVTSRNPSMRRNVPPEALAEVDKMEQEEAISLLLNAASLDSSSDDLRRTSRTIVSELCCLPLAVDQAGASISAGLCNIHDYLRMYTQHRQELLAYPSFRGTSNYGRAVYGTWDLSFKAIEGKANGQSGSVDDAKSAILILQTFAFFHHENITEDILERVARASQKNGPPQSKKGFRLLPSFLRVKRDMSRRGAKASQKADLSGDLSRATSDRLPQLNKNGSWDSLLFRKGISVLRSFSLVKGDTSGRIYSVHPLVHLWSRDRMTRSGQETHYHIAKMLLYRSVTWDSASEDYAFRRTLVPHIKAIGQHAVELGMAKTYNDAEYTNFGLVLYESGYWNEAEELNIQVMETRKRVLGAEHPDTLRSTGNLASTFRNHGRWKEAEELEIQVMETRKRLLGAEHPDTLRSMGN